MRISIAGRPFPGKIRRQSPGPLLIDGTDAALKAHGNPASAAKITARMTVATRAADRPDRTGPTQQWHAILAVANRLHRHQDGPQLAFPADTWKAFTDHSG